MWSLQLPNCRVFKDGNFSSSSSDKLQKCVVFSSFWGVELCFNDGRFTASSAVKRRQYRPISVMSSSSDSPFNMNLNEYMVTLVKPLGIRFALSVDGKVFVHALKKGGNAEKSRIIMVGDTLKKAGDSSTGGFIEIKDFGDTEYETRMMNENSGPCSLVLERPSFPFPIHQLYLMDDIDIMYNRGRVPVATWNKNLLASNLRTSCEGSGNSGFVVFSPKLLTLNGWNVLSDGDQIRQQGILNGTPPLPFSPIINIFSAKDTGDSEWAHGNFPLEEYVKALDRSKGELYYNHDLGMRYSKGITAVVNFQSGIEAENWGINANIINESCQRFNILMINYPIREGDSFDMRKKLPFCVGLLLRLLKKNHRVYVTCTTGFDRSPACVVAYLHWMTDTSLHAAYNFVTGLHSCKPDRPAIAWATWDLIAMVENGAHDGPATHAVTFVWNGHEGEDVYLVGDFTGNWKEPIQAVHKGGPRFEAEVRLSQGKYLYKYIISGNWRHSTNSPTERDERGNLNNVIVVGDVASVRPFIQQQKKDANIMKVIERPLTENERFMLAKAARCVAFSICPITLAPK
ncbi:hypothetical protein AABB24_039950 [Solanum stoloniferum]|uniref:Phosphoglucan phosphatase LSF1, chloroplastic n=1 Tax=Solanum stoloniferum TaxID=62892 RepID=A0ABD2QVP3_9SOLN